MGQIKWFDHPVGTVVVHRVCMCRNGVRAAARCTQYGVLFAEVCTDCTIMTFHGPPRAQAVQVWPSWRSPGTVLLAANGSAVTDSLRSLGIHCGFIDQHCGVLLP
jgi:hypothetical protein